MQNVLLSMFVLALSASFGLAESKKPKPLETYAPIEGGSSTVRGKVPPGKPVATAPYDAVPPEHLNSLLKRLEIVENLIKRHQRAYDYRTVPTQKLEEILKQLEEEKSKSVEPGNTNDSETEI